MENKGVAETAFAGRLAKLCERDGYTDLRFFANGRTAVLQRLLFTYALLADLNEWGYEDRWCYGSYAKAKAALDAWDGEGEPSGWHRHPDTGRRRPDGDATREYVEL